MARNVVKRLIVFLLIAAFIVIQGIVPMVYHVSGVSMEPSLKDGQWILIDYYGFEENYSFQDIIVFKQGNHRLVKRIIGIAGDHIQIVNNILYINSEKINEDYIKEEMETKDLDFIVPEGTVFVLGDNRNESADSREFGLVNINEINGKLLYIF